MFDPFGIQNQINSMFNNFMSDPFAPNISRNNNINNNHQLLARTNFDHLGHLNMFANPFDPLLFAQQQQQHMMGNQFAQQQQQHMMGNQFALMNQLMSNNINDSNVIHADPSSQIYSSSSVMTMSSSNGKPKIYQQTTQVQQGPDGVKETRNMIRDSEKRIEKVSVGHHIGHRSHVIERQKVNGGHVEEIVNLENLDENEVNEFNNEFENKLKQNIAHPHFRAHPHSINSHQQQPLELEDRQHRRGRKSKSKNNNLKS